MTLPATKRVRWDDSVLEICQRSREAEKTKPNVAAPPDNGPPPTSCKANDAIRLSSVRSVKDLSPTWPGKDLDQWGFRPDFTHQLFDEERIVGYREGDVAVHLVYTAASLHFLVKIRTSDGDVKMKAEILSRLSKALPPSEHYTTDEAIFRQQLEKWHRGFKPPGNRVHEYHKNSKAFSVYRAAGDDPGAREYHDRAQCLAPWFIEYSIDLEDDRWEVFYVFEEKTPREVLGEKWLPEAFVGYFTIFGFRNPVKGVSLRICQALILPQFQRQGHGQALLAYLYDLARSRESVFEVTVEDPAPGFEKVRNLVDARTLRDHKVFPEALLAPESFQRPPKDVIQAAHEAVKLTVSQVEIGFDILKARNVETFTESPSSTEDGSFVGETGSITGKDQRMETDDTRKRFRLMVKRRLLKRHGEELSTDSTTRKGQLEELYRDVEEGLLSLGTKLKAEEARDESKTA